MCRFRRFAATLRCSLRSRLDLAIIILFWDNAATLAEMPSVEPFSVGLPVPGPVEAGQTIRIDDTACGISTVDIVPRNGDISMKWPVGRM